MYDMPQKFFLANDTLHLLSHFAGEIKSATSKVESLVTGSDSFSVLVKLIEEEASVI